MHSGRAPLITFYWRPGCGFCRRLHADLVATGLTFEMRNIWEDADAAAFVRSVARGHETVPTVSVGDAALVNPPVERIIDLVQSSS
jgi:glutaredoxin-like protein